MVNLLQASNLGDFAIYFSADERLKEKKDIIDSAYQVKIGAYKNTCDLVIRNGVRLWQRAHRSLQHNTMHHLIVERVFERILVTLMENFSVIFPMTSQFNHNIASNLDYSLGKRQLT